MAAVLHMLDQRRLIDSNGIADGASIYFYTTGTLTPAAVYTTSALSVEHSSPIVVAAGAAVPDIYLDSTVTYRRRIVYPDGSVDDTDPYSAPFASSADLTAVQAVTDRIDLRTLILWYGNSIVEGNGLTPASTVLQATLNATSDKYSVVNMGRSGETAAQIRDRVDEYIAAGYAGIMVIFGPDAVNSVRTGVSAVNIESELQAMYTAASGAGATVVVLTDTPWKNYVDGNPSYSWDAGKQAITEAVNTWKAATATDVDDVVDLYAQMGDGSDSALLSSTYNSGDELHPNQAGQNFIAARVAAEVTFAEDADRGVLVRGSAGVVDQDVSARGSPIFSQITVGADQGGFGPVYPLIKAQYDSDAGTRQLAFGGAVGDDSRDITIDGVWKVTFRSVDRTTNDGRQARIGVPLASYGTGEGDLAFELGWGGSMHEVARFKKSNGRFGIGTTDPQRLLSISNADEETYEIDPGILVSGQISHVSVDRTTSNYLPDYHYALSHVWTVDGTDPGMELNNTGLLPSTTNDLALGSTALRWSKLWAVNVEATTAYSVNGTQVVGAQGAAVADATDAASAITQLNALLARCRAHGLIAT